MNALSFLDFFHLFTSGGTAPSPGSPAANLQILVAGLAVAEAFGVIKMPTASGLTPEQQKSIAALLTALGINGVVLPGTTTTA
jgi:hypothetical protein